MVLEPDEELTALVREELPLPRRSGISVRPVAGRPGLGEVRDGWAEAVVVDAFAGAEVPPDLVDLGAWQEYARVATGPVVLNLRDRAPFPRARAAVAGLRACFGAIAVGAETATWRGRREGNLLLLGGAAPTGGGPGYRWRTDQEVADALGGGIPS